MRHALLLILTAALAACSARTAAPPQIDPNLEQAAFASTALKGTLRLVFNFSIVDRDARFSGEGSTRLQAPDRARLDLFGPRGETLLAAALVDDDFRIAPGPLAQLALKMLPPPTLMWSVIGVFRKPDNAQLVNAKRDGALVTLEYEAGDQSWAFTLEDGKLQRAEWQGPQQGRQTVEIKNYHARGIPSQVTYRDWREFRELTLELSQVHDAESFPADTWLPGVR